MNWMYAGVSMLPGLGIAANGNAAALQDILLAMPDQSPTQPVTTAPSYARFEEDMRQITDAAHQPTLIFDASGKFCYFNRSFNALARACARDVSVRQAACLAHLHPDLIPAAAIALASARGEWSGEIFIAPPTGRPIVLQLQLMRLGDDAAFDSRFGAIFRDASEEYARGCELQNRNVELEAANAKYRSAHEQLIQTEKLASIGQLAAGVAHEINNPIGYVHSNLATLVSYTNHLLALIEAYEEAVTRPSSNPMLAEINEMRRRFDIEFVRTDLPQLLSESQEGVERVRKIVQDLKDFSRSDASDEWILADLHKGLDSTLNIVWNELKYKARVVKTYGELPRVQCIPSELNQVFLNILVNAGQAIEQNGVITVTTSLEGSEACVAIGDDGAGIADEVLPRIFDPFFTTKTVGAGTGLGLSISYGIVKKHGGRFEVSSTPGQGTLFKIYIPVQRPAREAVPA
jgi:two-component system NtrC family sensor kinase